MKTDRERMVELIDIVQENIADLRATGHEREFILASLTTLNTTQLEILKVLIDIKERLTDD